MRDVQPRSLDFFFFLEVFIKVFTRETRSISSYFLVSLLLQSTVVFPKVGHHQFSSVQWLSRVRLFAAP